MTTRRSTLAWRLLPGLLLTFLLAWQGGEAVRAMRHGAGPDVVLAHRRAPAPRAAAAPLHLTPPAMLVTAAPPMSFLASARAPALAGRHAAVHAAAASYRQDYPRPPRSEV
ncbi:MAG: hypothetical protein IRZ00_08375 [Gemmatimonadetes bacterium]|nr:hypothetical protein [Gemmatimonadota bacterium]